MWVIAVDSFGTEHIATTRGTNLVHNPHQPPCDFAGHSPAESPNLPQ